ncbi:GMC oxidoreductase [Sporormia fimetaria CBS 119925]|uniref:GMC oxidoreductase n=1 Tax=Sporormia fimetaria CBS 119925 TaxID=1340428 RepID=A0A6A6V413_9PLEO|nr:GMC oxidoreductase [Sporormia fimetaria CBS 119925]
MAHFRLSVIFTSTLLSLTPLISGACTPIDSNKTYDYIVIGSGAGGIPVADRLSEAGHSVLLLEKGPLSSGRWNGTMKPEWLEGTNLTRFDVPGLFNQIWADPVGVSCEDLDVMAGCVLGGGIAVNSALWWKPHPRDWDLNFPAGWKSSDMQKHIETVFKRIPGTDHPSRDGKLYLQQGYDTLSKGLEAAGFKYVLPNESPDQKNHTYGRATFFLENAERHGPLATYLVTAAQRKNFNLAVNTMARRLVRTGGSVTGVELQCRNGEGFNGTVNVTPKTGRVILSAGTMGSAKVLFRSGIGPKDALNVVKNSTIDGATMISEDQWIDLPVGYNLNDHVGTDIQIAHPDIVFYDFYEAWDEPIQADVDEYLKNRSGILAQVAPNLGPMFWQTIEGSDGIVRHIQWQARVEGRTNTSMTITQYVGTGTQSRGRMTILPTLNTRVSQAPYLRNAGDKEAVIQGIEYIRGVLSNIGNLTWIVPTVNQTTAEFVNLVRRIPSLPSPLIFHYFAPACTSQLPRSYTRTHDSR